MRVSNANAKLEGLAAVCRFVNQIENPGKLYSFDLPAGKTCPGALYCKSQAVKVGSSWRIKDGPHCRFRCYAASQEVIFSKTRKKRERNRQWIRSMRTPNQIVNGFNEEIPDDCIILRMHSSGDFFRETYFAGILELARQRSDLVIYGYTKNIPLLVMYKKEIAALDNLNLVASLGGRWDRLAKRHHFQTCEVVLSKEEARKKGLPIDHDDSYAAGFRGKVNFATLVHGPQPAGSEAALQRHQLRLQGFNGYRRNGESQSYFHGRKK